MNQLLMARGARILVERCARVQPGERVVIVTDPELLPAAEAIATASDPVAEETTVAVVRRPRWDGQEPPMAVAEAIKSADVFFWVMTREIGHTRAVREALQAGGRGIAVAGGMEVLIEGGVDADFEAARPLCDKMAQLLTEARTAYLTTPAGTNIRMSIEGRKGNSHSCILDGPGQATGFPNIEANTSPVEGTAEGEIVFDASIPNLRTVTRGVLKEPVKLTVREGRVVKVEGGYEARILDQLWSSLQDPNVYNIAQLAVGLNPVVREVNGIIGNDHGVWGTVHIGIGTSTLLGGTTQAAGHIDGIMYKPTLVLDDQTVVRDGEPTVSIDG